jgi:catechol 2,3-dioxygenase-like lactoylglutathione lyase family enzyme
MRRTMSNEESPLGEVGVAATTLYVSDLDKAIEWYRDKLGLEPTMPGADGHRYAGYLLGGVFVVLEPIEAALESSGPGAESTTINLVVGREPAVVRDALQVRGVECGPLVDSPGFSSFLIRDLDGNRFYVTRPHTPQGKESVRRALEESSPA